MSNIKISYPFGYFAHSVTTASTVTATSDIYNYSRGHRSAHCERSSAGTSFIITYDFGSTNTRKADHLIIARADIMQDDGTSGVLLQRSTNNSTWTTEHTVSSFSSYSLKCPTNTDLIDTFTESSAYRYWRLNLSGTSTTFKHSKHSFGVGFDFGDDPVDVVPGVSHESYSTEHASGDITFLRLRRPQRTYKITWRGITDAKILEADQQFLMWPDMPLFLYTTTNDEILGDFEVVQVEIQRKPKVTKLANDYNEITIDFIEQLG